MDECRLDVGRRRLDYGQDSERVRGTRRGDGPERDAGRRKLDISWTAPTGDQVTGYDVHYTSSATVKNDTPDAEPSGNDASVAWVDAGHTGLTSSDEITGLTSLIFYYVRVRAVNDAGNSPGRSSRASPRRFRTGRR